MRDRPHRPVAVEHLDRQPARLEIGHHLRQRRRGRPGQIADRLLVAVDRPADEIVRAGIAHLDDEARRNARGVDEAVRALLVRGCANAIGARESSMTARR